MTSDPHFEGCEVVRQLRSGPATAWYLARQVSLGRPVVVKALSPNMLPDSAFAEPLTREARVLAKLHHPNIIQLYDYVQRDTRLWQVLEHVDGWTLDQARPHLGKVTVPVALAIALTLSRTLEYIHGLQIVHRDLQPSNIWVSSEGEVKIGNFFLAADQSSHAPAERLEAESGFGGPSYLSPEQVLGEPVDARSDVFSLGVVLYELLSGKRPFDAEDNFSTSQRIRHDPPEPLGQTLPEVPPTVERLIHRALQKLPADRFANAAEMSAVLEQALSHYGGGEPQRIVRRALVGADLVEARRDSSASPRWIVRNPRPIRNALWVYLLCSGAIAGSAFVADHFEETQKQAPVDGTAPRLVPTAAGKLRAVAYPWAHVFIDGEKLATTPFSEAIPVLPGTHYVRFEHPSAVAEHRTITVEPQQDIFLDVKMRLELPETDPTPDLMKPPQIDAGPQSP